MTGRRLSLWVVALALTVACHGTRRDARDSTAQQPSSEVSAVTVQNGESAFTVLRPLPSRDSLAALTGRPADVAPAHDTGLTISVSYDGARARVLITTPDGRVVSDTTRPRDTSCDDFAPDTSSDPNADGIGCLADEYGTTISNSRPGVGYVQITAIDSGVVSLGIETLVQRNYVVGDWGVSALRVRPGQTHIFQVTLFRRREDGPILVTSLTGPMDTTVVSR